MKNENRDAFLAQLTLMEEQGESTAEEYTTTRHNLIIGDDVTGCCGGVFVEEDINEHGQFNFEILLGPANAKRLVDFLRTLPKEPEYDDDLGACPACGGRLTTGRDCDGDYVVCNQDNVCKWKRHTTEAERVETRGYALPGEVGYTECRGGPDTCGGCDRCLRQQFENRGVDDALKGGF
jgi:hypothetical protein